MQDEGILQASKDGVDTLCAKASTESAVFACDVGECELKNFCRFTNEPYLGNGKAR